jgi:hypothetical protein
MNFRDPSLLVGGAVGAAIVFLPGRGFMGPAIWFGTPRMGLLIPMALVIFFAVFFGTLKFWKMLTGESLQKPIPGILALALAVRLTVDCARMMMWRW